MPQFPYDQIKNYGRSTRRSQLRWCKDDWHYNYQGAPYDGSAWVSWTFPPKVKEKVIRGGSWKYIPNLCRSASRSKGTILNPYDHVGFRVVCDAPLTT